MRLWSIHPKYLDSIGLVACWREALLAQKVLLCQTKGYKNHPQLERFYYHIAPLEAIGNYLTYLYLEAVRRKYNFDDTKIIYKNFDGDIEKIDVTIGQLKYEFKHLQDKLKTRDQEKYGSNDIEINQCNNKIEIHSLFYKIKGEIESWEKIQSTTH